MVATWRLVSSSAIVDDDITEFLRVAQDAHATDDEFLRADAAVAAAGVLVGTGDRRVDVVDRDARSRESDRIDANLVIPLEAAERHDICHAGDGPQPPFHHEILDGAQVFEAAGARERVAVDLADGRRLGPHLRRGALRERGVAKPFSHARAQLEIGRALLERERHQRQAEHGDAPKVEQFRSSREHPLELDGHPALHLFCGLPRIGAHDLDTGISDVGEGLDRQPFKAPPAKETEHRRQGEHGPPPGDGDGAESFEHSKGLQQPVEFTVEEHCAG